MSRVPRIDAPTVDAANSPWVVNANRIVAARRAGRRVDTIAQARAWKDGR